MKLSTRWSWLLDSVVSQLWFRASLFSVLAAATALVAVFLEPLIPEQWPAVVGADAVDGILSILASSMLTVTVFSLTTMVSAYSAATSNVTPRATRLLVEDSTSQNALSTFLGAFLFSLVGIIALSTGVYGRNGRLVLFGATLLVILLIVVTLLRWISHLSTLGQVGDSIARVERAAMDAFDQRIEHPYLGGMPLSARSASAVPVFGRSTGYLVHVDMAALEQLARRIGIVQVGVLPGAFVHASRALAWVETDDQDTHKAVRAAFTVGSARNYSQDPRFGLIVLSEIGSRALSSGINDAGTAISVIGAAVRILERWREPDMQPPENEQPFPCVQAPGLSTDDLFDDFFGPIARDGSSMIEVGARLQKALATLSALGDEAMRSASQRHSTFALEHAARGLKLESDHRRLVELTLALRSANGPSGAARQAQAQKPDSPMQRE